MFVFINFFIIFQSSLPCPVMYVPLNEDNDEIKTNPDLFSDTNSHVGSQCTEDGVRKIPDPDSASEVGELPQIPNKKPVSRVTGFHSTIVRVNQVIVTISMKIRV